MRPDFDALQPGVAKAPPDGARCGRKSQSDAPPADRDRTAAILRLLAYALRERDAARPVGIEGVIG